MKWESLKLSSTENLWSYIVLKGAYVLSLKLKEKREYAEKKKELLTDIIATTRHFNLNPIKRYLQSIKEALLINGYHVKVCKVRALNRVLIGISESFGKIPFEVGIFFDPVMNVPFIPGSSLKGVFRHSLKALLEKSGKKGNEAEEKARIIFGSEEWSGLVGVTDAYPVELGINGFLFEPDVITPHYPGAETELNVNPNPIHFLTIARGTVFEFYIYFNKEIYQDEHKWLKKMKRKPKRVHEQLGTITVKDLISGKSIDNPIDNALFAGDLAKGIKELKATGIDVVKVIPWVDRAVLYAFAKGIGAKTSLGYSRFEVIKYDVVEG